jgi:hypothetical protein
VIELVFFCGTLGCAIGFFVIAPAIVQQRLEDDLMAGEFDSDGQWNALRVGQHRELQRTMNWKSHHAVWCRARLDPAGNRAVASIVSSGTHMSTAHLSTRLLRLLGSLLLPQSKRFRVSWRGDIFIPNTPDQERKSPASNGSI